MIPAATTTVSNYRSPQTNSEEDNSYDGVDATPVLVTSGIPAVISISPSGKEELLAGEQEVLNFKLVSDVFDLQHPDLLVDDSTGDQYQVTWVVKRVGLGLDHMSASLRLVSGASLS